MLYLPFVRTATSFCWDRTGLCLPIAATIFKGSIVAFIAMIRRSCVAFSRIRHFHCCNFIAGVTVPAEVVKHAGAFDTIYQDSLGRRWDSRPQNAYYMNRSHRNDDFHSFLINWYEARCYSAPASGLVEAYPEVRYSGPCCKSTLQPLITDIYRLMWAYGISRGLCSRKYRIIMGIDL